MTKLAEMIEENGRGSLPKENRGLPSLDLTEMQGITIPTDFEITGVLGDILMCEIVDEDAQGDVLRNGIWLKQEVTQKMWRVAKVVKIGPHCSENIKIDDYVMYPSDKGLPMMKHHKKYIFLNEPRIFCICRPM